MRGDELDKELEDGDDARQGRDDGNEDGPDDAQLIWRIRGGDGDALRELMRRYDRLVRYTVFRLCRTECQQDPAFLDARASETWAGFVRSAQRSGTHFPQNIKTYLIQIAKNKCIDSLRREEAASLGGMNGLSEELVHADDAPAAGLELLIRAEEVVALRDCIETLSHGDKRICEQIEPILAGRWKQAAHALDIPESTVRSRWPVIVRTLRACLEKKNSRSFAPGFHPGDP